MTTASIVPHVAPGRMLFVHQSTDLYGSDRVLLDVVRAVAAAGGEAIVVLPGDGPLAAALDADGIEVHRLDDRAVLKLSRAVMTPRGLLRLAASVPAALRALDRCAAGRRIDWVHSNTLAVLAGALWARQRRVRHMWHVHEIVDRPAVAARGFPWLVHRLADAVVCNSHATRWRLLEVEPRLAARARVVWNGALPPASAEPANSSLARAFRPMGARLAIGLVGRINRMKGHELLLDAAERLNERGIDDFAIVFAGSPPPGQDQFLARLHARVAASPLRDRVVLQGFTSSLAATYAALDIVCVPSTEPEAFGLVAVEAMAAGRPVLAARIGGLQEIVLPGQTGLLHRAGDAASLADALRQLLASAPLRERLGRAGRLRFEREFTVAVMQRRMLGAFAGEPA